MPAVALIKKYPQSFLEGLRNYKAIRSWLGG
jgi:hypothetical protein